jgi:hypothetical protein
MNKAGREIVSINAQAESFHVPAMLISGESVIFRPVQECEDNAEIAGGYDTYGILPGPVAKRAVPFQAPTSPFPTVTVPSLVPAGFVQFRAAGGAVPP